MSDGLALHHIAGNSSSKAVVFIHGVDGNWTDTWTNPETGFFWPKALAERVGDMMTFSLQYDARTRWHGETMPLQERGISVLEFLHANDDLQNKEIAFVAHSFGGLVAKQLVRRAHDQSRRYAGFLSRLSGIAFVATPHTGAAVATFGNLLRFFLGSTVTLEDLRASSPLLMELNAWYRDFEDAPTSHVVFETRNFKAGWFRTIGVVSRGSSDPGIRGAVLLPVDADHSEIARPMNAEAPQFISIQKFIESVFSVPARLAKFPRQVAAVCYRQKDGNYEFLLIRTTGGRWTFPKGNIEPGESLSEAAAREAFEEAGLRGDIEHEPFTHYLHAKRERKRNSRHDKLYCVAAFLLKVTNANAGEPEEERIPTWFAPARCKEALSDDRDLKYQQELDRVVDEAMARLP
jgi:8-oxo-dGTP pyrophosphatase MutT (NUDIX family)